MSTDNSLQSIFGMNVKNPLFPRLTLASTPNHTTTHSPTHTTPTSTADLSGPSQHYWTMSQYLEISLPLTAAVILLPLIAGPCFRCASQQYEVHRQHWRALFVVLVILYFLGAVGMAVVLAYRRTSWTDTFNWESAYLIWCYPVLGALCVFRLVRAYRQKQSRFKWSLQLLIFAACLTLDVVITDSVDDDVPFALVLLLSLFLMSKICVRWLKRGWTWLSWKTRRQSATGYSSITVV